MVRSTQPAVPADSKYSRRPVKLDVQRSPEDGFLGDDLGEILQLSDSEESAPPSPARPSAHQRKESLPEDISKDLAALNELRKNVKKNLRLRPIRSRSNLSRVNKEKHSFTVPKSPTLPTLTSPTSTTSSYFTPLAEAPASFSATATPTASPPQTASPPPTLQTPCAISAKSLYTRIISAKRPLVIDTRPLASYQSFHIRYSINIAIPSLILKRCRRPGGGLQSLDTLRQFVTTEQGKQAWDRLMVAGGPWDGDVVIYDEEMELKDKDNPSVVSWAVIPIVLPLLNGGSVDYLDGGISTAGHNPQLETLIVTGDEADPTSVSPLPPPKATGPQTRKASLGLLQLDTQLAHRSKNLPEIEPGSTIDTKPPSPPPRSPMPLMPATSNTRNPHMLNSLDASPSPPPSSIGFRRPPPPRRPSVPNLRRLDTKSTDRLNLNINTNLPKLSLRTKQMRSATLAVPPSLSINPPQSPSILQLVHSHHHISPPPTGSLNKFPLSPTDDPASYLTPYYTPPHTPGTPKAPTTPTTPMTARPDGSDFDPPTTEDAYSAFTISTILPNFLYLGPELSLPEHVEELQELGVKRILNIAVECDDDLGLNLREVFDKYYKIPMRDTVEEDNITRGVREVCDILDDARLHSAPTYVHCKAGKSRSVTAVMAYLIHANHWTLSRAYTFVLDRRKGISPNIGFVSELMKFEEQELGGKSIGVQTGAGGGGDASGGPSGGAVSDFISSGSHMRRGHVRESLPPALGMEGISSSGPGPMSAGGIMDRVMGDSGQEMEIKDASGRYRHARRAPVDETTLQPMRRVSKAGLESFNYSQPSS